MFIPQVNLPEQASETRWEEKPLTMVFGNWAFENVFNSLSLINNYKLGG
jgi:hypothetical protein